MKDLDVFMEELFEEFPDVKEAYDKLMEEELKYEDNQKSATEIGGV